MPRVVGRSYAVMSSQPVERPRFVPAMKYRYLPDASHAGDVASEKPSVIWLVLPVSTLYTNTAWSRLSRCFTYAIQRESGDHTGSIVRVGTMYGSVSKCVALPVATSTSHSFRSVSVKRIFFESGDHAGV